MSVSLFLQLARLVKLGDAFVDEITCEHNGTLAAKARNFIIFAKSFLVGRVDNIGKFFLVSLPTPREWP